MERGAWLRKWNRETHMSYHYINIWAEKNGRIIEKSNLRVQFFKGVPVVKGTYYILNKPAYSNGQEFGQGATTNWIHREFTKIEDAVSHLRRSFEEFSEKYPIYKGHVKIGDLWIVNGKEVEHSS